MNRSHTTYAVLLTAAALASGCAAGESRGELAHTRYGERAEAILCDRSDAVLSAVSGAVVRGDEDPAAVGERLLPAYRAAYERLRALPAPAGRGAVVDAALDDMHAALGAAAADPSRLDSDDDPMTPVDERLAELGLGGCL